MPTFRPLLFAIFAVLAACSSDHTVEPAPRPVRTMVVKAQALAPEVSYSGEVVARYVTPMSFRVSGKLSARKVDIGSKVKVGQVLAILDLEDLKLNAATQHAAKLAAESEKARAQADYERFVLLREKRLVSEIDFKRVETALRVAEAQYEQAAAQSRVFENQASYGQLVADTNGVVTEVKAEVGQVVAAGQSVITIAREGAREIKIDIPEARVDELKKATGISVTLWAKPDNRYHGELRELAPDSDRVTRTYDARISILDADNDVKLGMTATVALQGISVQGVSVPLTALYQSGEHAQVWIVSAENTVSKRQVSLGDFHGNDILVLSGLNDGERLITAGVNRVIEGQRVSLMDAP